MLTANPTKEERLAVKIAKFLVAKRYPRIKADELETIFGELGYGEKEIEDFLAYMQTPEGSEYFSKSIRLELFKAGYRPQEVEP